MAAPQPSNNQASSSIQPGTGTTEVRLGNQASEYARRNGIPEITKGGNTTNERNAKDQNVTKISATLPGGETWTQNWLERMRGEAKIKIPSWSGNATRPAQNAADEARDGYLEQYFASRDASASTMRQFVGRKKLNLENPRKESPSLISEEIMDTSDDTATEEEQQPTDYTNQPAQAQRSGPETDTSEAQAEIESGLSMGQVRRGLLGPAIATASATGAMTLLALSSSDTSTATALIRTLSHLIA